MNSYKSRAIDMVSMMCGTHVQCETSIKKHTNVALGILRRGELRALLFQFCFELIELRIRKNRVPLQVGLHRCQILGLLTIHIHHCGTIPSEILLQEIKLGIFEELSSADVVGLDGKK